MFCICRALNLSNNGIDDPCVIETLASLPSLRVLYLKNNPVCALIPNYRRSIIARCAHLNFLDDRAVTPDERRLVDAWYLRGPNEFSSTFESTILVYLGTTGCEQGQRERRKNEPGSKASVREDLKPAT